MPCWVRRVFLSLLPRVMFMTRPEKDQEVPAKQCSVHPPVFSKQTSVCRGPQLLLCPTELNEASRTALLCREHHCSSCWKKHISNMTSEGAEDGGSPCSSSESLDGFLCMSAVSPQVREAIESVKYIAENMRLQNEAKEVQDDWKYVAMVIDRIFLWVFVLVCILGTAGLFLQPLLLGEDM